MAPLISHLIHSCLHPTQASHFFQTLYSAASRGPGEKQEDHPSEALQMEPRWRRCCASSPDPTYLLLPAIQVLSSPPVVLFPFFCTESFVVSFLVIPVFCSLYPRFLSVSDTPCRSLYRLVIPYVALDNFCRYIFSIYNHFIPLDLTRNSFAT